MRLNASDISNLSRDRKEMERMLYSKLHVLNWRQSIATASGWRAPSLGRVTHMKWLNDQQHTELQLPTQKCSLFVFCSSSSTPWLKMLKQSQTKLGRPNHTSKPLETSLHGVGKQHKHHKPFLSLLLMRGLSLAIAKSSSDRPGVRPKLLYSCGNHFVFLPQSEKLQGIGALGGQKYSKPISTIIATLGEVETSKRMRSKAVPIGCAAKCNEQWNTHGIPMEYPDLPRLGARNVPDIPRDTLCHAPVCCSAEPGSHPPKPLQCDTNITWTSRGHYVLDMFWICLVYVWYMLGICFDMLLISWTSHLWSHFVVTFCGHVCGNSRICCIYMYWLHRIKDIKALLSSKSSWGQAFLSSNRPWVVQSR